MSREFAFLKALACSVVLHSTPLVEGADPAVIGHPFIVMEWIDGFSPRDPLPEPFGTDLATRLQLAHDLIDALAAIARVDWQAVVLDAFGRPDEFDARWDGGLASSRSTGRASPARQGVADRLTTHRPATGPTGVVHGDYQFLNMMYANSPPHRVAAVVD